jgi:hypothetical protein
MQLAAQIVKAPVRSRECRGHHGKHFTPVPGGDGHWLYYWLTLPQMWFWRSRSSAERAELTRTSTSECFICLLQQALERETVLGDGF